MADFTEYGKGEKNNWRRKSWNTCARKLRESGVSKKKATILYLGAAGDLDRKVAVSKGFSPERMYSVDDDPEIIASLRSQGKCAVLGEFSEVVANWGGPIDVIWADYCCGLQAAVINLVLRLLCCESVTESTVVMVNLQRGREPGIADLREELTTSFAIPKTMHKHRGMLLMLWTLNVFSTWPLHEMGRTLGQIEKANKWVWDNQSPAFDSYRSHASKGLYFDSVIFTAGIWGRVKAESDLIASAGWKNTKMRRQIAAAKAVSTMRQRGALPSAPRW